MKAIVGFENYYSVTNDGSIYSHKKEKFLSPVNNGAGYMKVSLSRHGEVANRYVHRVVAEAFLENKKNLPQVNHIDGDKSNNKSSNLEWCTPAQNIEHAIQKGLISFEDRVYRLREVRHGRVNEYINYGCRCQDCRSANTTYQREIRKSKALLLGAT